ncbi:UTRA domain-containing protein [Rodentibacter pneumotropicus]|uniref:UTRA domain-containing protein n=2 Tax=Rodentibacter pneumotropicus TaxID=758 RepID=A0A4S2Q9I2_9PAST|nr:UTRA domain-containing protein [Rodentibacter pneumotropicus]NBH74665.1 UTRA domain-containing protein [Rodentibacter pneumotropicus]OOF64098.1 GntR family transcriptional regulator [Rodentibacter pneumotropicus]OOF65048.1 GntR family transcriptional regulator [Rodentibacter pneumotropicus]TGZ99890.1 UTRA domain-containing protein [Rodentibacter pneumotropicus]THA00045.1 UTRA domain-containing protein [Rodentibacter pneumotropicus]
MSKYKKVYNDIKTKISKGVLTKNQELPSENELMQHYGFSKDTIRKALLLLEMDGYIQKQQGRNSIVLEQNLLKPQQLSEIKTQRELDYSSTHQVKTTLTSLYIVQGEEKLMDIFNVNEQIDFYRIGRVREIDGENVEYELSYFDRRIVPFISRDIAEQSIYHYLENELGLKISHSQRKITFRYANEEEKNVLDLGGYEMVVSVTSTTYLADGRPFQYGSISYRPDKIIFATTAKREIKHSSSE